MEIVHRFSLPLSIYKGDDRSILNFDSNPVKNRGTNSKNETLTRHRTVTLHPSSDIRRDEAESVASGA